MLDALNTDWLRRLWRSSQPYCFVHRTSNQTISNLTDTAVLWNDDLNDVWGMHDPSTNSERIVAPFRGRYLFMVNITWPPSGSGTTPKRLRLEATNLTLNESGTVEGGAHFSEFDMVGTPDAALEIQHLSGIADLNKDDYVFAEVLQGTGGDLDIVSSSYTTSLMAVYLG